MRKLQFLICFCVTSILTAQTRLPWYKQTLDDNVINYGFYIGFQKSGYQITATSGQINNGVGFNVGILSEIRLNENYSLIFDPGMASNSNILKMGTKNLDMSTTKLCIPINLVFRADRLRNIRPFVMGGMGYAYNFSADKNKGSGGANEYDFVLTKNNLYSQVGIGTNLYFPYFKFTPVLKGIYGYNNEYKGLGSTAITSINELRTRGVFLSLIFE